MSQTKLYTTGFSKNASKSACDSALMPLTFFFLVIFFLLGHVKGAVGQYKLDQVNSSVTNGCYCWVIGEFTAKLRHVLESRDG